MKVKFKVYDVDFLILQGYPKESIRKIAFLLPSKEYTGDLVGDEVYRGNYIIPSNFCQYIRLCE